MIHGTIECFPERLIYIRFYGTVLFHENITSGVPDTLESFILSLFSGCTDPFASNYNADATVNDGTVHMKQNLKIYTFLGTVESSSYYLSNNALS